MSWEIKTILVSILNAHPVFLQSSKHCNVSKVLIFVLSWQISSDICNDSSWCPAIKGRTHKLQFQGVYGKIQINLKI